MKKIKTFPAGTDQEKIIREYLFRGLRLDGRGWVYGNLI